jgi:mannose-6-phosphate isomerase-like protein (cupin superfamily)
MRRPLRPIAPSRGRLLRGPAGEAVCSPLEDDEFHSAENIRILEAWNVAEDPAVSIARARLGPGQATEVHVLSRTTERYLVVRGAGRVEVGNLPPTDVGPGDVVLIPAGTPQRIRNTGVEDLVFYCICTPRFDESDYRRAASVAPCCDDE